MRGEETSLLRASDVDDAIFFFVNENKTRFDFFFIFFLSESEERIYIARRRRSYPSVESGRSVLRIVLEVRGCQVNKKKYTKRYFLHGP